MIDWGQVIVGVFAAAAAFGGSWLLFRGKKVEAATADSEVEQSAAEAFLSGQQTFQAYVDGVVEKRVEAAVAPYEQRLADVEQKLLDVRSVYDEMHAAVQARETQLWLWDQRGRPGRLPKLPDPILHRLGLSYLADDEWHTEQPET